MSAHTQGPNWKCANYIIRCDECGGEHARITGQARAWDEATAHERATGHATYVALAAIAKATGIVGAADDR